MDKKSLMEVYTNSLDEASEFASMASKVAKNHISIKRAIDGYNFPNGKCGSFDEYMERALLLTCHRRITEEIVFALNDAERINAVECLEVPNGINYSSYRLSSPISFNSVDDINIVSYNSFGIELGNENEWCLFSLNMYYGESEVKTAKDIINALFA